jgi:hypothetical protein
MPNDIVQSFADAQCRPAGLSDDDVDAFVSSLSAVGYSPLTVRAKRQIAASFAQWTRQNQIAIVDLDERHEVSVRNIEEVKGPRYRQRNGAATVPQLPPQFGKCSTSCGCME